MEPQDPRAPVTIQSNSMCCATQSADIAYFTPLEWHVIDQARMDSLSNIATVHRTSSDPAIYVEVDHVRPSPCRRMQVLRRAAVLAWHGRSEWPDQSPDFYEAGFSPEQGALLARHIRRGHDGHRSASRPIDFSLRVMA